VHWSLKHFISWQQEQLRAATAAAAVSQQPQAGAGNGGSTSASSSSSTSTPQPSQPWQQQLFRQILGPQLQLLTAAQAAALEAPCLLQQTEARQRQPGSPSKLKAVGNPASLGGTAAEKQQPQEQGLGVPIGVLAGWLNPYNQQQWLPGGGCLWDSLQVSLLEVLVNVARVANAPVDAWEGAAALLR